MPRLCLICIFCSVFIVSDACFGQANQRGNQNMPTRLTYVPRDLSRPGDIKIVVVPATNARQARLDAQTYHIGWDAIDARMGQSRVMFEVLLRKRPARTPGTAPVTRPIPRDQPNRR